jgi:hypothetical protein
LPNNRLCSWCCTRHIDICGSAACTFRWRDAAGVEFVVIPIVVLVVVPVVVLVVIAVVVLVVITVVVVVVVAVVIFVVIAIVVVVVVAVVIIIVLPVVVFVVFAVVVFVVSIVISVVAGDDSVISFGKGYICTRMRLEIILLHTFKGNLLSFGVAKAKLARAAARTESWRSFIVGIDILLTRTVFTLQ